MFGCFNYQFKLITLQSNSK
ncbi:hypothetical protein D046_7994, partial [Vibrio parahaemolyticus V-223/04]